jgi:hypothetical protein
MLNYITRGQVEAAPAENTTSTVFYLSHQAVKKKKHGKTKWGIVFYAYSHETYAPSLKHILEMGYNLLPEIFAILLRFRLHPQPSSAISHSVLSTDPRRKRQRLDQIHMVQNYAG